MTSFSVETPPLFMPGNVNPKDDVFWLSVLLFNYFKNQSTSVFPSAEGASNPRDFCVVHDGRNNPTKSRWLGFTLHW